MDSNEFLNRPSLRDDLEGALKASLRTVLEGAEADLQDFAHEISGEMLTAAASGDDEALQELLAQVRALGEANRLRAGGASWKVAADVVHGLTTFVISTALRS
ncbi:MAG: hypothetical protein AAB295_03760 [Chloroflexota bacterium]